MIRSPDEEIEKDNPRANAPRFAVAEETKARPQTAAEPRGRYGHVPEKTTVKTSGMFNKGSMGTDIITWDNQYQSKTKDLGDVSKAGKSSAEQTGLRDRKMVEEQLFELDLQVEKTNIELNNVVNHQPKTGVTMKKKRELEDRLEVLEKQRANLRSRLRMGIPRS